MFFTKISKAMLTMTAFLMAFVWQSWTTPNHFKTTNFTTVVALQTVGSWNRLLPSERTTLENGGTVSGFDLGICDDMGNAITADITSGPAPNAGNSSSINTRRPRRWGNTSFYLARAMNNSAGVEFCFDFSVPVAGFSMDSREHAYFANGEAITVTANNAGTGVNLNASFFGNPLFPGNGMSGNGTPEVTLDAGSTEGGGLWWEVSSMGDTVTQVCIQYYGGNATVEPFRLNIEGDKCVADDAVLCGGMDWVSRWTEMNTSRRVDLLEGRNVYNFKSGFCDESGDGINFLEISASPSANSGNYWKNGKEPRSYGLYSFDNGRHFPGMGGNTYCFTLDEAKPVQVSSQEHMFFQNGEVVHVSAYLGTDPVILNGFHNGGPGFVSGGFGGITFYGMGYGNDSWWEADSGDQPVSQICVEYYVQGGVPLGREPFAIGICGSRCLYDDPYSCSLGGGSCNGFPKLDITKEVTPLNGFGLDLCNNPGNGLPAYEITIRMENIGGAVKQLWLEEDLATYFGSAYNYYLTPPEIILSTAAADPVINPNWDGITDTDLFMPATGGLNAGQGIIIAFTVELDPNAGAPTDLLNSVYGGGISHGGGSYNDNSGSVPGGPGYPTLFQNLPANYTAEPAQDLTLEATIPNFMNGIDDWLADNGGAYFHVPGCAPVTWTNDYDPANWVQGCGQITGSILVTFTATDACGHEFITCATFTLEDTQGPNCVKPDDLTLDCNDPNAAATLAEWLDYDGNFQELSTPVVFTNDFMGLDSTGCDGDSVIVTWTATDACGNESYFSATLHVAEDTIPPSFGNVPGNLTLDRCDSIPDPDSITVMDGCDPNPDLVLDETTTGDSCDFTITRTWTATDDCGNSSMYVQTINVKDENPPVFSNVPADTTAECPVVPPIVDPDVTDCSAFTLEFEETQIGGLCPLPSQIIRTWIATDECGNTDTVTQIVTMTAPMDTSMIVFDPPSLLDITAACSDTLDFDSVTVTTTCPAGGLDVFVEDVVNNNGDCSQPFSVTRTWIAHDACGNLDSISQTLFIGPDTLAPIFDVNNPVDIMVDCSDNPVMPIAFDDCGPTALSYEDSNVMGNCDTGFTFIRTWTATDLCGNTSTFSQNVTTSPDTTAPVFLFVPYDEFFDCDDTITFDDPIVFDNCSSVTVTFQDSIIGTGDCNEVNGQIYGYDIIRTWIATDSCGNVATAETQAWVIPEGNRIAFTHVPEDRLLDCNGGTVDFGQAVCHSICSEVTLTFEDTYEGDCDNGTTITRVWTGTDDCGNSATATQLITIAPDEEPPVFSNVIPDGTYNCNDGMPVFDTPTVSDNCGSGANITMTHNDVWNNTGDCGSFFITRTWTAVDLCGNENSVSQTLALVDTEAPVFQSIFEDKTVSCGDPIIFTSAEAIDDCSNAELSFTDATVALCNGSYAFVRTWEATDACGNVATATQTITAMDDKAPVFDLIPADKTINCGEAVDFGQPEVSDACSGASLTYVDSEETFTCETVYTRTWTATDSCGNVSHGEQKITVIDMEAPVFETSVTDQFIGCDEVPVFADVEATDGCSSLDITFSDAEEVLTCETIVTRTWTATDACGNSSQLSQSIHLMDNDAPVLEGVPSNMEMTQAEFASWMPPTVTATDCSMITIEIDSSYESTCDYATYTYNYIAMDGCGNTSADNFEVLITDAAFAMELEIPDTLDCGESYDLLINTDNGTAPFAYSWQIFSGNGWQISAMPGEPMATILAGEGEAVINVSVVDITGCIVFQELTLDCDAGVNATTFAEISAFELKPNPVSDAFSVTFNSSIAGNAEMSIVNVLGNQVATFHNAISLGSNQFDFDTAELPSGTYFLVLQMEDNMAVEQFVKIR